jgi:hypothetical protein
VGKIHSRRIHARKAHGGYDFFRFTRRSNCADDFGFSHDLSPHQYSLFMNSHQVLPRFLTAMDEITIFIIPVYSAGEYHLKFEAYRDIA